MHVKKGTFMKHIYLLLCVLTINGTINCMKRNRNNATTKSSNQLTPLTTLPDECLLQIFSFINPAWNNWQENAIQLFTAINTLIPLTQASKHFNTTFSPERIASVLHINDTNKNLFLLRSAQVGIPCFVRHAITLGADVHYDKNDEYQPLPCAVEHKNHTCARLLLEAGALTTQSTKHFPVYRQPIQVATQIEDVEMVQLLLEFNADPNTIGLLDMNRAVGVTIYQSTLDIALTLKNARIAQLLINKEAEIPTKDVDELKKLLATFKPKQKNRKTKK